MTQMSKPGADSTYIGEIFLCKHCTHPSRFFLQPNTDSSRGQLMLHMLRHNMMVGGPEAKESVLTLLKTMMGAHYKNNSTLPPAIQARCVMWSSVLSSQERMCSAFQWHSFVICLHDACLVRGVMGSNDMHIHLYGTHCRCCEL